jgi:Tfp pilus assembly protein PilN
MESWAVIAIVAIVASFVGGMYRNRLRHENQAGTRVEGQLKDLAARLEKLEATIEKRDVVQRLNALEAIVTDRRFELRREIDELDHD